MLSGEVSHQEKTMARVIASIECVLVCTVMTSAHAGGGVVVYEKLPPPISKEYLRINVPLLSNV